MNGILAIDTASPGGIALAFATGDEIRTLSREGTQDHSQQLLTAIDEIVDRNRRAVGAIGVATGPGSYAGLRVGLATAESLGMGLDIPVFGFGTFTAIAAAAGSGSGSGSGSAATAIHPAGRGEWVVQQIREGPLIGAPAIVTAEGLPAAESLAGEGAGALGGREISREDRARAIVQLAAERLAHGTRPQGLQAFYLREPNITRPKRAKILPAGR